MVLAGKAAIIAKEMVCYNLSVLGVTKWTQSVEVKLASVQSIIFSGHKDNGANRTEGIAIMMTKETKKRSACMGTHHLSPHHCVLQNQQQES